MKMESFPIYDPVCVLLEVTFSTWTKTDQQDFLKCGKPTPKLDVSKVSKWKERVIVRKFQTAWYSQFAWLCGSYYLKKLFCLPCLLVGRKNTSGFGDFGNVSRSLNKHESSAEHLRNTLEFKKLKLNINPIQVALKENSRLCIQKFNEKVHLNKSFMQLPIRAILFLAKQEWPNISDNFKELVEALVSVSPANIQEHYKTIASVFKTNSNTIQTELIDCISEYIDERIENELKECDFFSICVFESAHIDVQTSQYSIIIRYLNRNILKERFLGFYNVISDQSSTDDTLLNLIICIIEKYEYKTKLVAQSYDGVTAGLQMKMKQVAPQAVFVHALAYQLNSILEQSCKNIFKCRVFFATVSGLPSYFQNSAKRTHIQMPAALAAPWTSKFKILALINNKWDALKDAFHQVINDLSSDKNSIRQSRSFLRDFNDFDFALLAVIFNDIFTHTEALFDVLQKKSLDVTFCMSQINCAQKLLSDKRKETAFMELFQIAEERATFRVKNNLTINETFEKYKILYFEILETVTKQITTRFEDLNKIRFATLLDTSKFAEFSKKFPKAALESLQECYLHVFSELQFQRLKSELQLMYASEEFCLANINDLFNCLSEYKDDVFKETYKLLSLIITMSCTSFNVEPIVSCFNRIKTYLWNESSEERLSDLAKISIEKELLEDLLVSEPFFDDIIEKFASLDDRKIDLEFKKQE